MGYTKITGFTAERMKMIEDKTVVKGSINKSGDLILSTRDGGQINAGSVVGKTIDIVGTRSSAPTSSMGKPNDAYVVGKNLYVKTGDDKWVNVGDISGPKGDKGDKGDKGVKGDIGPKGDPSDTTNTTNVLDRRYTDETPEWYINNHPRQRVLEMKTSNAISFPLASYYILLETTVLWRDFSAGPIQQTGRAGDTIYIRRSISPTAWGEWKAIATK